MKHAVSLNIIIYLSYMDISVGFFLSIARFKVNRIYRVVLGMEHGFTITIVFKGGKEITFFLNQNNICWGLLIVVLLFNEERTFSCDSHSKDLGNMNVYYNRSTKLNMKGAKLWASCFNKSILLWRDNEYLGSSSQEVHYGDRKSVV